MHRARIVAWLAADSSGFFEWLAARPWYAQIHADWIDAIPVQAGERGLEVGCGPGLLTKAVCARGVHMTGLDRSGAMVRRARKNAVDCTFIEGDALALPLDDGQVDVAFAASVVNVVDEPDKLVAELARVVRSAGRVSVLFPTPLLRDRAAQRAEELGLQGLSAAALGFWGSKAPVREPSVIVALFEEAGLVDVVVHRLFGDTIASVTGRVA